MNRTPSLPPATLAKALSMYGVTDYRLLRTESGYRNTSYVVASPGRATQNLIAYKNEPGIVDRIRRANRIGDFLAGSGFPARQTLGDKRILALRTPSASRFTALYHYLPGVTIPWQAYRRTHIKLLGWAMGDMHRLLRSFNGSDDFPHVCDEYKTHMERVEKYFCNEEVQRAMRQKLSLGVSAEHIRSVRNFIFAAKDIPGSQVLHLDFVRGNILFSTTLEASQDKNQQYVIGETILSGVIDFEKAAIGHPLFDIARTLAFLSADCSTKTLEQLKRYFIQSGYRKRGENFITSVTVAAENSEQYDLLETAMTMFLLYDLYKLLRQNPYESLHENYHFIRTRAMLTARKVVY